MYSFPFYSNEECDAILSYLSNQLQYFISQTQCTKVVLGLSGGIDSALVFAIAVHSVGINNVLPIFMPSEYTTQESIECVQSIEKIYAIEVPRISIHSLITAYVKEYNTIFSPFLEGIALENVQSRIRANMLMSHANMHNALVLATGNKSELAVGFCTLYGDTCGAIAPIGDIYKSHVYQIAHRTKEVYGVELPEMLFTKAPSAELAYKQKDEDRLPPYSVLDAILYAMENNIDAEGFSSKDRAIVERLYTTATFKRRFYPPIISITI